jgi:hypothetical protein
VVEDTNRIDTSKLDNNLKAYIERAMQQLPAVKS